MQKKSYAIQFILTVLFGPIGLFYSSVGAALFFLFLGIVLAPVIWVLSPVIIWPVSILIGFITVRNRNEDAESYLARGGF